MLEIIETDRAPRPVGPYSQAVRAGGFIFVSGQIPLDPTTGEMRAGGIEAQTEQVISNLAAILEAAGSGLGRIVKTTVFLADLEDFSSFNRIYGERLGDAKPARATVQVAKLPKASLLQIDAIALE